MKSFTQLAKVAYLGYCRLRLATSRIPNEKLPAWEELSPTEQAWWHGAARDVAAEIASIH